MKVLYIGQEQYACGGIFHANYFVLVYTSIKNNTDDRLVRTWIFKYSIFF